MLSDKDSCCLKIFKILLLDFFGSVQKKLTNQPIINLEICAMLQPGYQLVFDLILTIQKILPSFQN